MEDSRPSISLDEAYQLTGNAKLKTWWGLPGFVRWFSNREEYRQRLDYLAMLALDTAEEILCDREAHPSARTAMAKLVIEAAGKMPPKPLAKRPDEVNTGGMQELAGMSRERLLELVRKAGKLLPTQEQKKVEDTDGN